MVNKSAKENKVLYINNKHKIILFYVYFNPSKCYDVLFLKKVIIIIICLSGTRPHN